MELERWVIHVDLDAFFASVEQLLNPDLRGKPVIVGGSADQRGVVCAASYPARKFGVRSAMPVAQALRLCPQAIVVRPQYREYARYSEQVMSVLHDVSPVVEQISIDEAFVDATGCQVMWGPVQSLGAMIQQRIRQECNLPVSLGIASSKLVAKIACDEGKPEGLLLVPHGEEAAFLAPLPIEKLWGVGQVTGQALRDLGIETIGDLASWSEESLVSRFGDHGRHLHRASHGIDRRDVRPTHERRSISQERTFGQDVADGAQLERTILGMSESVARRLRSAGLVAQTVRIKLRTPDFSTITRQVSLEQPTDQAEMVHSSALKLFRDNWVRGKPMRLIGVGVSGLLAGGGYQLDLFDQEDQRRIRLTEALDGIRDRFGGKAIIRASLLRREGDRRSSEDDNKVR